MLYLTKREKKWILNIAKWNTFIMKNNTNSNLVVSKEQFESKCNFKVLFFLKILPNRSNVNYGLNVC